MKRFIKAEVDIKTFADSFFKDIENNFKNNLIEFNQTTDLNGYPELIISLKVDEIFDTIFENTSKFLEEKGIIKGDIDDFGISKLRLGDGIKYGIMEDILNYIGSYNYPEGITYLNYTSPVEYIVTYMPYADLSNLMSDGGTIITIYLKKKKKK